MKKNKIIVSIKIVPIITFILVLLLSLFVTLGLYKVTQADSVVKFNYTIIIDAGHGGRDAGASGINTGVKESDLSLAISKKLQKYLIDFGFDVVMTRETPAGLYSENVSNFKKDDMEKRSQLINKSSADMIVSVHLNSFSSISEKGAQAFYEPTNPSSITLSNCIQNQLLNSLPSARKNANKGDYYILKTKNIPCSLIECGFLSNPKDAENLTGPEYQKKVAFTIYKGLSEYLEEVKSKESKQNDGEAESFLYMQ